MVFVSCLCRNQEESDFVCFVLEFMWLQGLVFSMLKKGLLHSIVEVKGLHLEASRAFVLEFNA